MRRVLTLLLAPQLHRCAAGVQRAVQRRRVEGGWVMAGAEYKRLAVAVDPRLKCAWPLRLPGHWY